MGKVSPKDGQSKTPKQKRLSKSTKSNYLRPGALAQHRNAKISAAKCSTDLWKKRVVVRNANVANEEVVLPNVVSDESPVFLSPARSSFGDMSSPMDLAKQNNLQMTPKTPRSVEGMSESRLESIPLDLLVNILCHLRHDHLKAVFHVSQKIRMAVILARQCHFNYTTPVRMPQDVLGITTPSPPYHYPFASKGHGKGALVHSPPYLFKCIKPITGVLFLESAFPKRRVVPSVIPKPLCKSFGSNKSPI